MKQVQSRNISKNTSITFRLPKKIKKDIGDIANKEMLKVSDIARRGVFQYIKSLQQKCSEKNSDV